MSEINLDLYKEDTDSVTHWIQSEYEERFSEYFKPVRCLSSVFLNEYTPISDDKLEEILTVVPLELFSVAEELNSLKLKYEVVKLRNKETQESEDIISGQLIAKSYQTLIERVEREISYCRELIMSAKKIWSARKQSETIGVPAESVEPELPEYNADSDRRL